MQLSGSALRQHTRRLCPKLFSWLFFKKRSPTAAGPRGAQLCCGCGTWHSLLSRSNGLLVCSARLHPLLMGRGGVLLRAAPCNRRTAVAKSTLLPAGACDNSLVCDRCFRLRLATAKGCAVSWQGASWACRRVKRSVAFRKRQVVVSQGSQQHQPEACTWQLLAARTWQPGTCHCTHCTWRCFHGEGTGQVLSGSSGFARLLPSSCSLGDTWTDFT